MATGANSRSDNTITFTFSSPRPGDCFTDKQAREIVRRLGGTLPAQGQLGDAIVSRTPPSDTTKIWYLADDNGIPTGQQFRYNPKTQRWESTEASIPPIPCRSINSENLIALDPSGCWLVSANAIAQIAQNNSLHVSSDPGNALTLSNDGGVYLSLTSFSIAPGANYIRRDVDGRVQAIPSTSEQNLAVYGSDGNILVRPPKIFDVPLILATAPSGGIPAGTININSFVAVPAWATHALVYQPNGNIYARIISGSISHPNLTDGQTITLAGFIRAQP